MTPAELVVCREARAAVGGVVRCDAGAAVALVTDAGDVVCREAGAAGGGVVCREAAAVRRLVGTRSVASVPA
jgi:hypothetical protein